MHILQWNDHNLALANMAKSANDMITSPAASGIPPAYCHVMVWGRKFPMESRDKAPVGICTGTKSPEA